MLHLLIAHAYPLMIPISLVEGPLVALAGGAGAAAGRINPWFVYAIVMAGGLFQDVAYYWIGRWIMCSPKARAMADHLHLTRKSLAPLESAWREKMFATLVASKFAYGLYAPIIVTAGMSKAPYWRFLGESLALSAVVLAGWLIAGLLLGRAYGALGRDASWVMAGLGVVAIGGLFWVGRTARKRLGSG
jgi:membrane protein DedA with SNARE-associated domain